MKKYHSTILWIARGITMLYILFLGIFSIDAFDGDQSIWVKLGGFFIHNIPSILLLLFLLYTWHRPLIAGILFVLFGIATILFFRTIEQGFQVFLVITLPIILTGILFILAWFISPKKPNSELPQTPDLHAH